jgi:N-acetylmuramoyl-L-alanine amidase
MRQAILLLLLALGCFAGCSTARVAGPAPAQEGKRAPSVPVPPPSSKGSHVVEKPLDASSARRTITHEVAPMESIWRIAKMYEVSEQSIYEANHLKAGEPIRIGQKLIIPNAKGMRNVVPLYANTRWKYLVVHHTATEIGKATIIHNSHHDRGFWKGLGYDFLIDNGTLGKGDGQIEVSPRWIKQQAGAHCQAGGMNEQGIGIALVGNFNAEQPTPAQMESLVYLTKILRDYYRIPVSHVVRHRDVMGAKTDCPGKSFPWQVYIKQLNL